MPQAEFTGANRPTLSYTPLDDQEFTRRLFTPISLEGMAYLAKTTWPISTVFRLYLENLNWVSNAETASGPTPRSARVCRVPERRRGAPAAARSQVRYALCRGARGSLTDGVPVGTGTPAAAVEAEKAGLEYRKDEQGELVASSRRRTQPILRVGNVDGERSRTSRPSAGCSNSIRAERTFDLTTDKLDPFLLGAAEKAWTRLDMETRSLLQVLFFVAHGVELPPEHVASGIAPQTMGPDGALFDWQQVTRGLFQVAARRARHRRPCADVAVRYNGYWFYIDERDRDTKATFALLVELSRLELGAKAGTSPILTLPLGGR